MVARSFDIPDKPRAKRSAGKAKASAKAKSLPVVRKNTTPESTARSERKLPAVRSGSEASASGRSGTPAVSTKSGELLNEVGSKRSTTPAAREGNVYEASRRAKPPMERSGSSVASGSSRSPAVSSKSGELLNEVGSKRSTTPSVREGNVYDASRRVKPPMERSGSSVAASRSSGLPAAMKSDNLPAVRSASGASGASGAGMASKLARGFGRAVTGGLGMALSPSELGSDDDMGMRSQTRKIAMPAYEKTKAPESKISKPAATTADKPSKPAVRSSTKQDDSDEAFWRDVRSSAQKMSEATREMARDTGEAKAATKTAREKLEALASDEDRGYKRGGSVRSSRGDGAVIKGRTKGRFI